jgi:hypothetical protein
MGRKESDLLNSEVGIDREIQEALAVDPSPEFFARVRMRIASEGPIRRFPYGWTAAIAFGVTALAVALSLVGRSKEVAFETVPGSVAGPMMMDIILDPVEPATVHAQTLHPSVNHPRRPRARDELDQVLISPRDRAAFERFITNVGAGKFVLSFDEPPAVIDTQVFTDIAIPPIRIDPIAPLAPAEGVHQ